MKGVDFVEVYHLHIQDQISSLGSSIVKIHWNYPKSTVWFFAYRWPKSMSKRDSLIVCFHLFHLWKKDSTSIFLLIKFPSKKYYRKKFIFFIVFKTATTTWFIIKVVTTLFCVIFDLELKVKKSPKSPLSHRSDKMSSTVVIFEKWPHNLCEPRQWSCFSWGINFTDFCSQLASMASI